MTPDRRTNPDSTYQFACKNCQTILDVPRSSAGVTGPCPVCGTEITAPYPPAPLPAEAAMPSGYPPPPPPREAAPGQPINVRPREVRRPAEQSSPAPRAAQEPLEKSERVRHVRESRAVSPHTGMSETHSEKENLMTLFKMVLAALLVGAVVALVFYWVKFQM